ncbi:MAG TPA: 3-deoxy-D-manno-octulosonic acid transferase [Candidatus Margulisiibacteriota bacterium]|nr:3-deoxy-D-manno-octulosonic acid transferase [Candidatus Margulisiibacteriota bacterium]
MFIIYDLIFLVFSLIYLPIYLFGRKFHPGFMMRLGFLPSGLKLDKPIWVHAVSLGEAMAVKGLIDGLRKEYPGKQFVISTVTSTGNKVARDIAKTSDFVTYLPFDLSFIVRKTLERINPSLFVIAETELWPNLISCLHKKGVPVITVNSRISDASFRGYSAIKLLLKPVIRNVGLFCAQTDTDAARLSSLGVSSARIKVTGNMKFDFKAPGESGNDGLKKGLLSNESEKLLVAGSTHQGEEEMILRVYRELLRRPLEFSLLLAPRHPERVAQVSSLVSRFGFRPVLISSLKFKCSECLTKPVFILDTVGSLVSFYAIADIVFVGGSLVKKGGHNILEPASLAKPVLFGPYMFNFRDIADLFLSHKAAIMVEDQQSLDKGIRRLFEEPLYCSQLGLRAKELFLANRGATERNLVLINKFIKR